MGFHQENADVEPIFKRFPIQIAASSPSMRLFCYDLSRLFHASAPNAAPPGSSHPSTAQVAELSLASYLASPHAPAASPSCCLAISSHMGQKDGFHALFMHFSCIFITFHLFFRLFKLFSTLSNPFRRLKKRGLPLAPLAALLGGIIINIS